MLTAVKTAFLRLFPRSTAERLRKRYRAAFRKGPRSGQPVFLLGVGAQKAGTTWLHDYLSGHPSADMGFTKEYHVFDGLYICDPEVRHEFVGKRIERLLSFGRNAPYEDRLIVDMISDVEVYFSYFESLVKTGKTIYLTGDISPCYSALPTGALAMVRNNLLQRGIRPRVIFMMRDPVDRCISAMRMELRDTGREMTGEAENRWLAETYADNWTELRSRYDRTMMNIEAVFPPDEVLYVFYEELFSEATIRRITEFLDIEYMDADFGKFVNVSRTGNVIDEELRRRIYLHLGSVYGFVKDRFGAERIRGLWESERTFGPPA
jgi:hypothetical protein